MKFKFNRLLRTSNFTYGVNGQILDPSQKLDLKKMHKMMFQSVMHACFMESNVILIISGFRLFKHGK